MLDENQRFAHAFFEDVDAANEAVRALIDASFESEHIGVLMARGTDVQELPVLHKTFVPHGVAVGALLGAAAGALTLSGVGVLAVGPLLAALQGAAAGTAVGSLGGALGGLGFWRDEVDFPANAFEAGAVLVGVVANRERLDDARAVLTGVGAKQTYVSSKAEASDSATARASGPVRRSSVPNLGKIGQG
jgi:hypothetical protein